MPDRAVVFTVTGQRQDYLRRTLDSWAAARGAEDWTFGFALEPCGKVFPVDAFWSWVQSTFPHAHLLKNGHRLGCLANTRRALDFAFGDLCAQFAVLAEEDITVSTDVLEYFSWAVPRAWEKELTAVCAHVKRSQSTDLAAVTQAAWFSPLVWGTWRDVWEGFIRPGWGGYDRNSEAWDTNLRLQITTAGRRCLFPARSRALHIGELSTLTTTQIAEYLYGMSRSECFTAEVPAQEYQEHPFDSLPPLVV